MKVRREGEPGIQRGWSGSSMVEQGTGMIATITTPIGSPEIAKPVMLPATTRTVTKARSETSTRMATVTSAMSAIEQAAQVEMIATTGREAFTPASRKCVMAGTTTAMGTSMKW
jgi:hypothetical protein